MMFRRFFLCCVGIAFAFGIGVPMASSTEVTGSLFFDEILVGEIFPEKEYGEISAYNQGSGERTYGTVDVVQSSYSISLAEGIYNFSIVLGEDEQTDSTAYLPGNLWGTQTGISIGSGPNQAVDFPMYSLIHVTAPLDNGDFGSHWGGSALDCPYGPQVPPQFRLEWDPVPGVNQYQVLVQYFSCDALVQNEAFPTANTFLDLVIDPALAENISLYIRGYGSSGPSITAMPYLHYGNAGTHSHWMHIPPGEGRPVHSSDSLMVLQVANLPGVGTSMWTSDLTLSNTGPSAVLAQLTFTPRNADGLIDYTTKTVEIPAFSCRTIKDVVGSLFARTGAGSIEISPATLRAYSRTATAADDGSYGQSFPTVAGDGEQWASLASGGIIRGAGVNRGPFRTNLVLAEIWGDPIEVRVELLNSDGVQIGLTNVSLHAMGNVQINDVVRVLTGDDGIELADGQIKVSVLSGDGRVAGALSIVDQGSDDPITVILE